MNRYSIVLEVKDTATNAVLARVYKTFPYVQEAFRNLFSGVQQMIEDHTFRLLIKENSDRKPPKP